MRKTLYLKFILAYLLFGVFGFIGVATFVTSMITDRCVRRNADDLYREATVIANTYAAELYSTTTSLDTVYRQISALSAYMDADIWIINPSGRLVVNSFSVPEPNNETVITSFDPGVTGTGFYFVGRFFDQYEGSRLSVLAPIIGGYRIKGYVCITKSYADIEREINSNVNIAYLELLVLILLSVIILIFFTEIVYRPLRRITTATEQYASGNMHYELSVDSEDEMGYLAASLNYMAHQIARSEDDQKKFIANISHDFRSPLTSIGGFLEAMLDGTIPPESHGKYLRIVQNETSRLTKLTNGLLALNNLNTSGMLLNRTDFNINDMIRRVAASFEQTCAKKRVTLELVLLGEELYANGDEERIEQVLYNLTDNAIKFTPSGTGVVRIESSERHKKVFVSVRDNGIGIPKKDIGQIFDRFYKSDLSRGRDKTGTGLGLSIVREIIRAHGENINVVSTEGVGSEFTFSLPGSRINDELEDI